MEENIDIFNVFQIKKVCDFESNDTRYTQYYYDQLGRFAFFFSQTKNEISYLNFLKKNKIISSFANKLLVNIFYIDQIRSIIFAYDKGEIYIIPLDYFDSEFFDMEWKKILNSKEIAKQNEKKLKTNTKLSDFLFCNDNSNEIDDKFKFSNNKSDKNKNFVFFQNLCHVNKSIESCIHSIRGVSIMSKINIIFWANYNNNKFNEKIARFLIINIDNMIIFIYLDVENFESEIFLKFNYSIDKMILVDYKSEYQYIILKTDSNFYKLSLLDSYNDLNVLDQNESEIIPHKLNFLHSSNLSVQSYNKETVVLNYDENCKIIEIFHPIDLEKPLININIQNICHNFEVLKVISHEKLFLLCLAENSKICFKLIINKSENLIPSKSDWFVLNYNNIDRLLFEKEFLIDEKVINYSLYEDEVCTDLYSLCQQNVSKKLKEKDLKNRINIYKEYRQDRINSKYLFSILTEKSFYLLNANIDSIKTDSIVQFKKIDLNYENLRKFEIICDNLGLDYHTIYKEIVEKKGLLDIDVLKISLICAINEHNVYENILKTYISMKSTPNFNEIFFNFIEYNIINSSFKKEIIYAVLFIELHKITESENLLKNHLNFFKYFENVNLIGLITHFELIINQNESHQKNNSNDDNIQEEDLSISSLNQIRYFDTDSANKSIRGKGSLFLENYLNQSQKSLQTLSKNDLYELQVTFSQNYVNRIVEIGLLILLNKNFFNIFLFSILNNKQISKDFEKKIKEIESLKISNFSKLKNKKELSNYLLKKLNKNFILYPKVLNIKLLSIHIILNFENCVKNSIDDLIIMKIKGLSLNKIFRILKFYIELLINIKNNELIVSSDFLLELSCFNLAEKRIKSSENTKLDDILTYFSKIYEEKTEFFMINKQCPKFILRVYKLIFYIISDLILEKNENSNEILKSFFFKIQKFLDLVVEMTDLTITQNIFKKIKSKLNEKTFPNYETRDYLRNQFELKNKIDDISIDNIPKNFNHLLLRDLRLSIGKALKSNSNQ